MDDTTIPDQILSKLVASLGPMKVDEICKMMPAVSRTSINRALTKLKDRGTATFHGRLVGWQAKRA